MDDNTQLTDGSLGASDSVGVTLADVLTRDGDDAGGTVETSEPRLPATPPFLIPIKMEASQPPLLSATSALIPIKMETVNGPPQSPEEEFQSARDEDEEEPVRLKLANILAARRACEEEAAAGREATLMLKREQVTPPPENPAPEQTAEAVHATANPLPESDSMDTSPAAAQLPAAPTPSQLIPMKMEPVTPTIDGGSPAAAAPISNDVRIKQEPLEEDAAAAAAVVLPQLIPIKMEEERLTGREYTQWLKTRTPFGVQPGNVSLIEIPDDQEDDDVIISSIFFANRNIKTLNPKVMIKTEPQNSPVPSQPEKQPGRRGRQPAGVTNSAAKSKPAQKKKPAARAPTPPPPAAYRSTAPRAQVREYEMYAERLKDRMDAEMAVFNEKDVKRENRTVELVNEVKQTLQIVKKDRAKLDPLEARMKMMEKEMKKLLGKIESQDKELESLKKDAAARRTSSSSIRIPQMDQDDKKDEGLVTPKKTPQNAKKRKTSPASTARKTKKSRLERASPDFADEPSSQSTVEGATKEGSQVRTRRSSKRLAVRMTAGNERRPWDFPLLNPADISLFEEPAGRANPDGFVPQSPPPAAAVVAPDDSEDLYGYPPLPPVPMADHEIKDEDDEEEEMIAVISQSEFLANKCAFCWNEDHVSDTCEYYPSIEARLAMCDNMQHCRKCLVMHPKRDCDPSTPETCIYCDSAEHHSAICPAEHHMAELEKIVKLNWELYGAEQRPVKGYRD